MTDHFDRVLRDAARRGRSVGVCPDAAMLAAYVDNGLTPAERREVEAHAAGCAACQQHLGLLGAVSLEQSAPAAARSWFPRWAWLVPAATAVLVAAVWVRLPEQDATEQLTAPSQQQFPAAPSDEPAPTAVLRAPAGGPAKEENRANELPAREAASQSARLRAVPAEPSAKTGGIQSLKKSGEREAAAKLAAAAPAPPAAPAAPRAPAAASPTTAADTAAAPPAVGQESLKAKALEERAEADQFASRDARNELKVAATHTESYRAKGQQIEMSSDGEQTWRQVATSPGGPYTAAACAQGVCWFGTADGRVERRLRGGQAGSVLPSREPVVAIAPVDARTAVVTLSSGAKYRTTDSGASWTREP